MNSGSDIPPKYRYKFLKACAERSEVTGRRYIFVFGERNNRRTSIVWRHFKNVDFENDKEIEGFNPDEVFINGDSFMKDYKLIESEFKTLMGV